MITVHDKYVMKYISEEYTGKHPGVLAQLFNTDTYGEYAKNVSEISKDLSQFNSGVDLVPYLANNYGLPLKKARNFVNKNATLNWKKGSSIDKKCQLMHVDRGIDNARKGLEETLDSHEQD